jgi:hypothetical protein
MTDKNLEDLGAVGGAEPKHDATKRERYLLDALSRMGLDPEREDPDDIIRFIRGRQKRVETTGVKEEEPIIKPLTLPASTVPTTPRTSLSFVEPDVRPKTPVNFRFPKLSYFFGEKDKGEVSWETFKFEIEALMADQIFTEEEILFGIRRAAKGTAGEIIRHLDLDTTVQEVIRKLNSTYGSIDNKQTILRKFYACTQGTDSVNTFASKLEEIYAQAIHLGAIRKDDRLLQEALYQGLNTELRHIALYKSETITDYDLFKMELRKLEADLKTPESETKAKTCHAAQYRDKKEEKSDMEQLKDIVMQLHNKIDQLQKEKDTEKQQQQQQQQQGTYYGGRRGFRGRGRFRGNRGGRSRGEYKPNRPLASQTFQGLCFICNEKGHMARDCPKNPQKDLKE